MKETLTVRQPYASMLVTGRKYYEFRSWPLPERHIHKPIRIHSAAREAKAAIGCTEETFKDGLKTARENGLFSAILGEVVFGRPFLILPGLYAWPVIDSTAYVEPVRNVKGRLGIWKQR